MATDPAGPLVGAQVGDEATSMRRVGLASAIGTAIEWYDFFLYGTAAALVFGKLFLPSLEPLAGTLAAFGTFAVGFVSRPIGGVVCGHFGDRVGRKAMLVLTLLLMGVATFLIGLLPTYDTIGVWAPILLVALRFIQGFGIGGELTGAQLMTVEYAPADRRGFYGSWPQMASPVGLTLSSVVLLAMTLLLSDEQFLSWGWRVPFLLSIVIVAVGIFIRLRVMETPAFRQVLATGTPSRAPIVDALKHDWRDILRTVGMYLGVTVIYYVNTVFMLAYLTTQLDQSRTTALALSLGANLIAFLAIGAGGVLSDRFGRRPIYIGGALFVVIMAFPAFALINTREPVLMFIGIVLQGVGMYLFAGVQGSYFAELFETRVRYSSMSLGITLATMIGGGTAPSLATALVAWAGGSSWPVAVYSMLIGLLAAGAAYTARETYKSDILDLPVPSGQEQRSMEKRRRAPDPAS
jgi:MFS transporter, MHS family, shikimate and dehydroshikimate transport protein